MLAMLFKVGESTTINPVHESRQSPLAARQALLARLKGQAAVESPARWRRDDHYV